MCSVCRFLISNFFRQGDQDASDARKWVKGWSEGEVEEEEVVGLVKGVLGVGLDTLCPKWIGRWGDLKTREVSRAQ